MGATCIEISTSNAEEMRPYQTTGRARKDDIGRDVIYFRI